MIDVRAFRRVMIGVMVLALSAAAQQRFTTTWMAGTLHPCTGDSVLVTEVTEYGAMGETITLTVLGMSSQWTDYNIYMVERSNFIHGAIALAGQSCGSGGVSSLPAIAATNTFQQTVFNNTAKPRMSVSTVRTTSVPVTPAPVPAAPAPVAPEQPAVPAAEPQTTPPVEGQTTTPVEGQTTPPVEPQTTAIVEAQTAAPAAEPTAAPAAKESGKAVQIDVTTKEAAPVLMLPPNNVTTDLEWNLFKQKGAKGNNYSLRAGYSRRLSNNKVTLGGSLIANTMVMLDKLFFNNSLNVYATCMLKETSTLERKFGGSFNTFLVDKVFYGTPFGMSAVIDFSDNWFISSDNILTYGLMAQESMVGDIKTTLVTAGVLYGLPISSRFALNVDVIAAYNAFTANKDGAIDVDSPLMLQPALSFTTYFSRLFSLDLGVKTTLLVKDYSDLIVTLGGAVIF